VSHPINPAQNISTATNASTARVFFFTAFSKISRTNAARERRDSLLSEVATLRARLAEAETTRTMVHNESHDDDNETGDESLENGAHARIAEVMAYAQSLESELAELRALAEASPEPTSIAKPSRVVMPTAPTPSWRKHLVAGIARHSRRG